MDKNYLEAQSFEEQKFAERAADWRNGSIIYQVFVDRFVKPENLSAKEQLYRQPKQLKKWNELPTPGTFLPEAHVWSHEIEFWGGDLKSLITKMDYLKELEIDVLYLNPIFSAFTNHKYDALDYFQISPEYGTQADLAALIEQVHQANMKIVLDGVFNHIGRQSELFQEALHNPTSSRRDWFYINEQLPHGTRLWANAHNLPELNYENPAVRKYLYEDENSVVRSYLRAGVDGWRLDVAYELGYPFLHELTKHAHQEKPGSLTVGEIWNYPQDWTPALDAVMNFTFRQIILNVVTGKTTPNLAGEMLAKVIEDAGIEAMLKAWVVLDNHDMIRLNASLPERADQKIAQVLQFTLPGSPNLYYGSELGMEGGADPANRAPMRWDLVSPENEVRAWTKTLIQLRKAQRALRIGDYRRVLANQLIAFERCTEKVNETVLILVNPTSQTVTENIMVPDSKLMNGTRFNDLLGSAQVFTMYSGILDVTLAPKSALVLKPDTEPVDGYSPYKRFA